MKSRYDRTGTKRRLISEGVLGILSTLDTYGFLPVEFIAASTGRPYDSIRHDVTDLHRAPNFYIKIHEEMSQMRGNFRSRIFHLDEKGKNILGKTHQPMTHDRQDNHRLMIATGLASIDIGAKNYGAKIVYSDDLEADIDFKPQNPKYPLSFDVHLAHNGDTKDLRYTPDEVRGYETAKGHVYVKFEFETGENRIDSSNLQQNSVMRKFLADREIFKVRKNPDLTEYRLFEKHWGIPNLLTAYITPNQTHINTMKKCLLDLTNGRGSSRTIFQTYPDLYTWREPIKPKPELFTGPWQRAGFPDYKFTDEV